MKSASRILVFCSMSACSAAPDVASSTAQLGDDAWQASLPANASDVMLGDAVNARGCTFTMGTAIEAPPFPPIYIAFVERSGHAKHCSTGYVILGTSYARPSVAIASGHGKLVVDWSAKSTPSGEAHTQLFIAEVGADSGAIEKQTELAAMSPDFEHPQLGNVFDGALDLHGVELVVTGDKNGIIPGEVGSGDHYTAVYDRDLVPTSVTAY